MGESAKGVLVEWGKFIAGLVVTGALGWIAHVKAVSALETRQDLGERRLNERVEEVARAVARLDEQGSLPARLHGQQLTYLTERMTKAEAQQAQTAAAISDMRSDIRVIAEWVKEQRGNKTTAK